MFQNENEADDYFFEAMDDKDVFHDVVEDETEKADIPSRTSFASLKEMM